MMSKIALITGAQGFIGRSLARELSCYGWTVHGLGRSAWSSGDLSSWGIAAWHTVDLRESIRTVLSLEPDLIVHCAGGSSVQIALHNPHEDFCNTSLTTSNVLEFARTRIKKPKLIYVSSAAVYGNASHEPINESTLCAPVSSYGYNKLISETLCRSYSELYKIQITVVRLFSVYGPGLQKQLIWDAWNKIKNKDFVFFGSGEEVRDWIYIDDAVSLIKVCADAQTEAYKTVNGGSGNGLTVRHILECLSNIMNSNDHIQFSNKAKDGDPNSFIADISLARSLGWSPKTELVEGLMMYKMWIER